MIKIDMEMPERCIDCPCQAVWFGEDKLEYNCGVTHKETDGAVGKPDWCPLIEVKEWIKIDMELPKNCPNCPLMVLIPPGFTRGESETGAYCQAGEFYIEIYDGQRFPDNCPMREVEE